MSEVGLLLQAVGFAADKHRNKRRKDKDASPYINHAIEVARLLAVAGEVTELPILMAGVLHDTVEDTETTFAELENAFGREVGRLVEEVTDDKHLAKDVRKRLQVENAQSLSAGAKQIRIADKICNVLDVTHSPPPNWPLERRGDYLNWAEKVVDACRGCNRNLEKRFDEVLQEGWANLGQGFYPREK